MPMLPPRSPATAARVAARGGGDVGDVAAGEVRAGGPGLDRLRRCGRDSRPRVRAERARMRSVTASTVGCMGCLLRLAIGEVDAARRRARRGRAPRAGRGSRARGRGRPRLSRRSIRISAAGAAAASTRAGSVMRGSSTPGAADADGGGRVGRQRGVEAHGAGKERGGVHVGAHAQHGDVEGQGELVERACDGGEAVLRLGRAAVEGHEFGGGSGPREERPASRRWFERSDEVGTQRSSVSVTTTRPRADRRGPARSASVRASCRPARRAGAARPARQDAQAVGEDRRPRLRPSRRARGSG